MGYEWPNFHLKCMAKGKMLTIGFRASNLTLSFPLTWEIMVYSIPKLAKYIGPALGPYSFVILHEAQVCLHLSALWVLLWKCQRLIPSIASVSATFIMIQCRDGW